jgi:hypothetical protein
LVGCWLVVVDTVVLVGPTQDKEYKQLTLRAQVEIMLLPLDI